MVSASLDNLESSVYLLYKHEIGESMGHHEAWELEEPCRSCSPQYIDLYTIAPTDDEYEILTHITPISQYFRECHRIHTFASLIAEDDRSLEFRYFIDQLLCLLTLDIVDFCVFHGLDGVDFYIFC